AELDLAALHPELRQVRGFFLGGLVVEDVEEKADIGEVRREIDIDAGEAFRGLVGKEEGGNHREKFARHAAALQDAKARIHHCAGNREAAEHFHQWGST